MADAASSKTYGVAIIGFGKIAQDQHAPAIMTSSRFHLVAAANGHSGDPPAGVQSFEHYEDMLKTCPEVEAVAICTPPGPRREIAETCLAAGRAVLLEKPPAGTVSEVHQIAAAAKRAGRVAFATYHAQHNGAVIRAAERLAGKTVSSLQVTWKEDIRHWHPGQDWILDAGGFGIFDPGINAFSILARILPEPIFITAAELFVPSNRQSPIAADLTFGAQSGGTLKAVLDWRQGGPPTWEIALTTTDGLSLRLADGGARLEVSGEAPFVGAADEYPDIYRDFADLLDRGESRVDASPFQLVADAFMMGRRTAVEPFSF